MSKLCCICCTCNKSVGDDVNGRRYRRTEFDNANEKYESVVAYDGSSDGSDHASSFNKEYESVAAYDGPYQASSFNEEYESVAAYDGPDQASSLEMLPTELVIKILSYLPTRERFMMQYVCRRFQDVTEMPLLWKEFVWPDLEPHHVCSVTKILQDHGEYVRKIFFPAYLAQAKILEMAKCCTQVTHLILPRDTKLSLDDLRKIVDTMKCLLHLDVFAAGNFTQRDESVDSVQRRVTRQLIVRLLEISSTSVKELNLHVDSHGKNLFTDINKSIKQLVDQGCHLPTINVYKNCTTMCFYSLWRDLQSNPAFKINLYQYKQITMNLYPPMPLQQYDFGPSATPFFIQLNADGMLYHSRSKIINLNEFDHNGIVRHTITPAHTFVGVKNVRINYTSCLHSVYYIDLSCANVHSDNLKRLSIMFPHLQRLNLENNVHCLEDLQGLHAIVYTCKSLEGLNLAGISVSEVQSCLRFWVLLSSLKKLSHLAIDLCLMKHDDDNKHQLIKILETFHNLKALEISRGYLKGCKECTNTTDFLFSHFPALTYCKMYCFRYSALTYAITNCHKLKYLQEKDARKGSPLPSSINCHLQQLCIYSLSFDLTDELVKVLSAHGQLECVILYVKSISITGITTLINNSPKLTILRISMIKPLFNENYENDPFRDYHDPPITYTDTIKQMFSYHKLFATGSFSVHVIAETIIGGVLATDLIDTDLKSLWPAIKHVW